MLHPLDNINEFSHFITPNNESEPIRETIIFAEVVVPNEEPNIIDLKDHLIEKVNHGSEEFSDPTKVKKILEVTLEEKQAAIKGAVNQLRGEIKALSESTITLPFLYTIISKIKQFINRHALADAKQNFILLHKFSLDLEKILIEEHHDAVGTDTVLDKILDEMESFIEILLIPEKASPIHISPFRKFEDAPFLKDIFLRLKESHPAKAEELLLSLSKHEPSEEELKVLSDILSYNPTPDQLIEIFNGGHVRLDDGGALYHKWKDLNNHERISSHPSIPGSTQHGIMGPWVHECLFGLVEEGGQVKTFFQLENTPWTHGITNRLGHTIDAITYVATGKNVGPQGYSKHVDSNPIRF